MAITPSIAKLRQFSDDDLIQAYDAAAQSTQTGPLFYLEEMHRRAQDRQTSLMLSYTKRMLCLTVIIGILTLANLAAVLLPALQTLLCKAPGVAQ